MEPWKEHWTGSQEASASYGPCDLDKRATWELLRLPSSTHFTSFLGRGESSDIVYVKALCKLHSTKRTGYCQVSIKRDISCNGQKTIGLAKKFNLDFFHKMLQKILNEHFDQPSQISGSNLTHCLFSWIKFFFSFLNIRTHGCVTFILQGRVE